MMTDLVLDSTTVLISYEHLEARPSSVMLSLRSHVLAMTKLIGLANPTLSVAHFNMLVSLDSESKNEKRTSYCQVFSYLLPHLLAMRSSPPFSLQACAKVEPSLGSGLFDNNVDSASKRKFLQRPLYGTIACFHICARHTLLQYGTRPRPAQLLNLRPGLDLRTCGCIAPRWQNE